MTIISSGRHSDDSEPIARPFSPAMAKGPEWESHLATVRDRLHPETYLEACLVERIAELAWRIRSLPLEGGSDLTDLFQPTPDHVAEAKSELSRAIHVVHLLETLPELNAALPFDARDAVLVLLAIAEECDADIDAIALPCLPPEVPFDEFLGWDAGLVRQAAATIALVARRDIEDAMRAAREHTTEAVGYYRWLIQTARGNAEPTPPIDGTQSLLVLQSLLRAELRACLAEYEIAKAASRTDHRALRPG